MKDLDDLAAFAVLHDLGSFTRAAERLGCSKGQLSKRIGVLEQKLGVTLLHRTTRRLSLTAAGAALLPEAQALLVQAERARQAVARLQERAEGRVRVTLPVSLGETLFDALLEDFQERHPLLRVELDLYNGLRDLVGEGFDLAIRSGVEQDARLVARPLFVLQEITCASPAYLARHGEPQRPAELAERECLLNSHYSGHEEWLYHRHHRLERVRVAGFLASNHYSLLKKAALAGTASPGCRHTWSTTNWATAAWPGCCATTRRAARRCSSSIRSRAACRGAPRCSPITCSTGSSAAGDN